MVVESKTPTPTTTSSSSGTPESTVSVVSLGTRNPRVPLPILDTNTNYSVWKRQLEGWFANEGVQEKAAQFEVIINCIKIPDIVEELVKMERLWGRPPTLDECFPTIRTRMAYLNNKSDHFRQLKILTIRPEETIDAFNRRFLDHYHSLGSDLKVQISVYDYMNAIRPRIELHHILTLREPSTIEDACQIAKNHEYWQEYNSITYGNPYRYMDSQRPLMTPTGMPMYAATAPYQYGYSPSNSLAHPGVTMPFPPRTPYYGNYWPEPTPFGMPLTMPPYPASEPIRVIPPYNPPNTFNNTRGTSKRNIRASPLTPGQVQEKLCWRCGQPGHLQKDCGRLNH